MKKVVYSIVIFYLLICNSCSSLQEDLNEVQYINPIKVAFLGPFSAVRMGAEGKFLGAYLAADEINNAGGINGRPIEIIRWDDAGSKTVGVDRANEIHNSGIDIIIGADWSSVTVEVAKEVTIPNEMLLISYSSTNPDISNLEDNNLVWRVPPSDKIQGKIGADYCYKQLHKRTAGILCFNNLWAIGLSNAFKETYLQYGGVITNYVVYPELNDDEISKFDFSPYLDTLFSQQPEVVYFAGFPSDASKITNDIAKNTYYNSKYNPQVFSNDGLFSNYFLINGHIEIVNGIMGTVPGAPSDAPNYMKYADNYKDRWDFEPVGFSEHAYDAVYLLAYAMLKSNTSNNVLEIASVLREISGGINVPGAVDINVNEFDKAAEIIKNGGHVNYNGASGNIEFDENGDPGSGTYLIWKIENGEYITETIVSF